MSVISIPDKNRADWETAQNAVERERSGRSCFQTKLRWNLGTRILPAATRSTSLPRKTTSGTTSVRFCLSRTCCYTSLRINSMPCSRSPSPRDSSSSLIPRTCHWAQHWCTLRPKPSARISRSASGSSSNRSRSIADRWSGNPMLQVEEVLLLVVEPVPCVDPPFMPVVGIRSRAEEHPRQVVLRLTLGEHPASTDRAPRRRNRRARASALTVSPGPLRSLSDDGDQPWATTAVREVRAMTSSDIWPPPPTLSNRIGPPPRPQRPRRDPVEFLHDPLHERDRHYALFSTRITSGSSARRHACPGTSSSVAAGRAVTRTRRP